MSLTMQTPKVIRFGPQSNIPLEARILIVCDDDRETRRLKTLLSAAGFISDCTKSVTTGCEAAKSGQFQVIVTIPQLRDGSWRRLTDIAIHYDLRFELVLWARNFDLRDWAEALDYGAFDVLNAAYDQPRVAEVIKCAFWAAYLKGAGPSPKAIRPSQVA